MIIVGKRWSEPSKLDFLTESAIVLASIGNLLVAGFIDCRTGHYLPSWNRYPKRNYPAAIVTKS